MEIVLIIASIGFIIGVVVGAVLAAVVECCTDVSDINVGDIDENKQKHL